jgi:hypothetical protein
MIIYTIPAWLYLSPSYCTYARDKILHEVPRQNYKKVSNIKEFKGIISKIKFYFKVYSALLICITVIQDFPMIDKNYMIFTCIVNKKAKKKRGSSN